jgi:hypothetical protein
VVDRGRVRDRASGRQVRAHGDIDVLVLRQDQAAVQRALPGWDWHAADPPGTWRPGEGLPGGVHDIWCRPGPGESWRVQVMLDESDGADWVCRPDSRVPRPVSGLGLVTADGVPYLAPEVQLFYMAKSPRPKDEADIAAVLPLLAGSRGNG